MAEADRLIDPDTIIERTVQYGLDNYPQFDREGHRQRTLDLDGELFIEIGQLHEKRLSDIN